jgi:hypothetical protein
VRRDSNLEFQRRRIGDLDFELRGHLPFGLAVHARFLVFNIDPSGIPGPPQTTSGSPADITRGV